MGVVIKSAIFLECRIKRLFAGMTERWVADVMRQRQPFGQILIQPQRACDHPGDLRNFKAVGQSDAVMIAIGSDEHLGLVAQTAEGDRMNNPVAVTLILAARPPRQIARE